MVQLIDISITWQKDLDCTRRENYMNRRTHEFRSVECIIEFCSIPALSILLNKSSPAVDVEIPRTGFHMPARVDSSIKPSDLQMGSDLDVLNVAHGAPRCDFRHLATHGVHCGRSDAKVRSYVRLHAATVSVKS